MRTGGAWPRWLLAVLMATCGAVGAQQTSDSAPPRDLGQVFDAEFDPVVSRPAYAMGRGPIVMIDEAHFNIHTAEGGYKPFAALLRRDGFRVVRFKSRFDRASLRAGQILVIANALAERTAQDWTLASLSAFTEEEIRCLHAWVENGGALFLIADHRPMPGAVHKLAEAFGIEWSNGYVFDSKSREPMRFTRADGSLHDHPITHGRSAAERVDVVTTFDGSAFRASGAVPLLTFGAGVVSHLAALVNGGFDGTEPTVDVQGWQQGAVLRVGKGRVALFAEAAMFTAQRKQPSGQPFGMNSPVAAQNPQFLLNVLHWLSGAITD